MDRDRGGRMERADRSGRRTDRGRDEDISTARPSPGSLRGAVARGADRPGAQRELTDGTRGIVAGGRIAVERAMIWVVLPAFNEEAALSTLLGRLDSTLRAHGGEYRLLVIDDGSRDATAPILEALRGTLPLDVI